MGGHGERHRAAVAVAVHRAHADLDVVLGQVRDGVRGDVAHRDRVRPQRIGRLAPHHLVAREVGLGVGVPLQRRVVGELRRVDLGVLRRRRRPREVGERRAVDPRDAGGVAEVDELQQIAELLAVLHAHVLVLVGEVLRRLGEARRRIALLQERDLVAAAQEAVAAPDQAHVHPGGRVLADLLDVARELARGPVVLAADGLAQSGLRRRLGGGHALGEQAHREGVAAALVAGRAADDVVGEHALDVHARRLGLSGEEVRAEEVLLLARHGHEDDRGVELALGHDPRELEHRGHARGVVVGARGVTGEVQDVGTARVVVAADHVDAFGRLGLRALQRGDEVGDRHRIGVARARRLDEGLLLHGHAPARGGRVALELAEDPVARGADAAIGIGLRGEGMSRAEAGELRDVALDVMGVDLAQHRAQRGRRPVGIVAGRARLAGGRGGRRDGDGSADGQDEPG